jgi:sugar/nucleoside kinase (ribokinase family)
MIRVVCCGLATVDIVHRLSTFPSSNEKVVAQESDMTFGGPAANAAATIVALGGSAVLVTALGSSALSDWLGLELGMSGVEVHDLQDGVISVPDLATVMITESTGDRSVVLSRSVKRPKLGRASPEVLDGADVLLVDGHNMSAAITLANEAANRGLPVLLDGGSWKAGTEDLLKCATAAVVSADFVKPHERDALASLRQLGVPWVASTHGSHPVRYLEDDRRGKIEVQHRELIDTVGAGDAFHGALAMLLGNSSLTFAQMLGIAATVATASCAYVGARGWTKDDEVVNELRALVRGHGQSRK